MKMPIRHLKFMALALIIAGSNNPVISSFQEPIQTEEDQTNPALKFKKHIPKPGQDAFWALHPQKPDQKILFVPSCHSLNLRFIRPDVEKEMKKGDILIVESGDRPKSWHALDTLKNIIGFSIEDLERLGAINRKTPFCCQEYNLVPWTTALSPLTYEPADGITLKIVEDFVEPLVSPIFEHIPLQNIHPAIVRATAGNILSTSKKLSGSMDEQIFRYFFLGDKPVHPLETEDELNSIMHNSFRKITDEEMRLFALLPFTLQNQMINFSLLPFPEKDPNFSLDGRRKTRREIDVQNILFKEDHQVNQRNQLWIPKLIGHFNRPENAAKSFTVTVGAWHFPGDQGLFQLLTNQGYRFQSFTAETQINPSPQKRVRTVPEGTYPRIEQALVNIESKSQKENLIYRQVAPLVESALKNEEIQQSLKKGELGESELICVTARLIRLFCAEKKSSPLFYKRTENHVENLTHYLNMKKEIIRDEHLKNKEDILLELERNPKLSQENLKF